MLGKLIPKIVIEGFENVNKVAMSKAINLNTPLNLRELKVITDNLLANGIVEISIDTSCNVLGLLSALNMANANVSCDIVWLLRGCKRFFTAHFRIKCGQGPYLGAP